MGNIPSWADSSVPQRRPLGSLRISSSPFAPQLLLSCRSQLVFGGTPQEQSSLDPPTDAASDNLNLSSCSSNLGCSSQPDLCDLCPPRVALMVELSAVLPPLRNHLRRVEANVTFSPPLTFRGEDGDPLSSRWTGPRTPRSLCRRRPVRATGGEVTQPFPGSAFSSLRLPAVIVLVDVTLMRGTFTSSLLQGPLAVAPTGPAVAPSTPLPWFRSLTVLTAARRLTSPSRTLWLWGRAEGVSTTSTTTWATPLPLHHPPLLLPTSWHQMGRMSCTSPPVLGRGTAQTGPVRPDSWFLSLSLSLQLRL